MRYFLILLAALLLGGTNASSQASGDYKPIAQKEKKSEQNISPSKPQPAPIEQQKPVPFQDAREKANAHTNEQLETDRQIAEYTRQLAIFTCLLVIVTAILALIAVWQGIQLKRTVDRARKEFIASHRPKIILRDATSEQDMGEQIVVKYILSNVGDTTAKIVSGALRVKVFEGWEFGPDNLPAIDDGKSEIDSITLKSGEQVNLSFTSPTLRWSDSNDTCHTFLEPEYGLFFSGHIVYEDDERTRRHTGFRRKFFSAQHRFLCVDSGPHYEYQD